MARLKSEQWEQARAEYEVRGVSLGEVAARFGVATSSVSRKAKAEGWTQGKMQGLAERKVAAVKELAEVETQTQNLPLRFQHTLDSVVKERLQADGLLASLDVALATRAIAMANRATSAEELETLSRARKNLAPPQERGGQTTTVTVNQQQAAQADVRLPSPRDALAEVVRQAAETRAEA